MIAIFCRWTSVPRSFLQSKDLRLSQFTESISHPGPAVANVELGKKERVDNSPAIKLNQFVQLAIIGQATRRWLASAR